MPPNTTLPSQQVKQRAFLHFSITHFINQSYACNTFPFFRS